MPPLVLHNSQTGAKAKILPELGFNCYEFQSPVQGRLVDVLDSEPGFEQGDKAPSHSGIPLLFPFPNRIRDGRFRWNDRDYQLPAGNGPNAIHGFVIDRPWRVIEATATSALGRFQLSVDAPDRLPLWPTDFIIDVRYTLEGSALQSHICISNPGSEPLPWGFGTHAYFRVPLSPQSNRDECLIQAPATEIWELIDCLPTGRRLPVSPPLDLREGQSLKGVKLDHVLTGVVPQRGHVEALVMDARSGLQISQVTDANFRELVVYTPPHGRSVCLEPYTCVTDAINLSQRGIDAGWRTLAPGEQFTTRISITAGLVLA